MKNFGEEAVNPTASERSYPLILRSALARVSKDAGPSGALWFETPLRGSSP
jgi:hypothetical protein